MSLSRVKTWTVGETLTASDLNAEFDNLINNPMSLISPCTANLDLDNHTILDAIYTHTVATFTDGDTTPSVVSGTVFKTANTAPTTITMFDGGSDGQIIWVLINDANTTIDFTGTNLKGHTGTDWTPTTGDSLQMVFINPNWYVNVSDNTV